MLVLPVTDKAMQNMGRVRTVSPELSRLLDPLAVCRPLACHALVHKLHNVVWACLYTRPRVLGKQTAR
eukprot:8594945-Lingulodinium_polyedra.AAC.1